jgi:hypothetical protein
MSLWSDIFAVGNPMGASVLLKTVWINIPGLEEKIARAIGRPTRPEAC